MKKEFSSAPESMKTMDNWGVHWADLVTALPSPLFLVTAYKSNGQPNACLHSWACFNGNDSGFYAVLSIVNKSGHMYKTIHETGVAVLNFPTAALSEKYFATVANNGFDTDEITASGFTVEPAAMVNAPRIRECFLNIECRFLWEREIKEGDYHVLMFLEAVNIAMDEDRLDERKKGRYGETGYVYNVCGVVNPDNVNDQQDGIIVLNKLIQE